MDAAEGEPCAEPGMQCAGELYCRRASDSDEGTCEKPVAGEAPEPTMCE
jgi:hypothetical protein